MGDNCLEDHGDYLDDDDQEREGGLILISIDGMTMLLMPTFSWSAHHHHNHHHHHHHHSHGYHDHHKPAQQSPGSRAWQAVSSGQQTPARPGSRGGGPSRSGLLPRSPSHHSHHHRGCTMRMVSLEVPIASDW